MPRGGARKGAGHKKGQQNKTTLEKKWFRERFMERMRDEWDSVINAQVELAKGIAIIDKKDDTGERIFDRPPSAEAGKNLMEQTMGKQKDDEPTNQTNNFYFITEEEKEQLKKIFPHK